MKKTPVLGFTLIETMIAITILTLAVSGAFMAANSALTVAEISRGQLTASYLAQEGIEYVRKVRDDAYLFRYSQNDPTASTDGWSDFLAKVASCSSANACALDPIMGLQQCSSGICPLYIRSDGIYTLDSGSGSNTLTSFTRKIRTMKVSATDEQASSTVSWNFHGQPYSITVTDDLTPWQ